MKDIDMHVHTTASDGSLTPTQVVARAREKGLGGIAITDHDTVEGIQEALDTARDTDFLVLPGIELSTEKQGDEIHILGYGINYYDSSLLKILDFLKNQRLLRGEKMIQRLQGLGLNVSFQEVMALAGEGSLGRPHIAQILVSKGYVKNTYEAFQRYLVKGAPGYVERFKLDPIEAIEQIKNAGGLAVVAHPSLIKGPDTLELLIDQGVHGIEVYHPDNGPEATALYLFMAKANGLMITGGSDFHHLLDTSESSRDIGTHRVAIESLRFFLSGVTTGNLTN